MGDSRVLSLLSGGMWGIIRGFVLIQDGDVRSPKDFWVRFGTLKQTQVFTGICGIRFVVIPINTLINLGRGFKVLPYKKCGGVHEKFDFLENTRLKTLEHLLKTF